MGKNIVLLSDGTGNSASKLFKTNVWRTYQAIDLSSPLGNESPVQEQIAYYRDGVGTETFKPLALLGGIFGFGVMKDVRALYTYLCRNYKPGDEIYAFGFSRGAFTIRLLIGLVAQCGLVQTNDEAERKRCVTYAYKAFRRHFIIKAAHNRGMVYNHILAPPYYNDDSTIRLPCKALYPEVAFLGLWDTVDAYGMPVDELKQAIDAWLWPMTLADRILSDKVRHACHALSLDDERPTFRPVLWDEGGEPSKRIEQVWFAGVHANIGGGYPIDDLAHVPLAWMLRKAETDGLRFEPRTIERFEAVADPHGTMYDSRSGVAGYYRYGPRDLDALAHDKINRVKLGPLRIHSSVAERIAKRQVRYAPVSLPLGYGLPHPTGHIVYQRVVYQQEARDVIWWRRVAYFTIVALTFILLSVPFIDAVVGSSYIPDERIIRMVDLLRNYTPTWSHPWMQSIGRHPIPMVVLGCALAWLFFLKSDQLQQWIANRSEWAWGNLKMMPARPVQSTISDRFARVVRTSRVARAIARVYRQRFPWLLGLSLFLGLIVGVSYLSVLLVRLLFVNAIGWTAVIALVVATIWFFLTNALRHDVERAVAPALGCRPGTCLPERRWHYNNEYLDDFKAAADAIKFGNGVSVLETYHTPVLLYRDIIFATALAIFIAACGGALCGKIGYPHWAPVFFTIGAAYGITDVSEDLVLSRLFSEQSTRVLWVWLCNWLTRAKMILVCLSGLGLAVFVALTLLDRSLEALKARNQRTSVPL